MLKKGREKRCGILSEIRRNSRRIAILGGIRERVMEKGVSWENLEGWQVWMGVVTIGN